MNLVRWNTGEYDIARIINAAIETLNVVLENNPTVWPQEVLDKVSQITTAQIVECSQVWLRQTIGEIVSDARTALRENVKETPETEAVGSVADWALRCVHMSIVYKCSDEMHPTAIGPDHLEKELIRAIRFANAHVGANLVRDSLAGIIGVSTQEWALWYALMCDTERGIDDNIAYARAAIGDGDQTGTR